jgi:hypothetical protein
MFFLCIGVAWNSSNKHIFKLLAVKTCKVKCFLGALEYG